MEKENNQRKSLALEVPLACLAGIFFGLGQGVLLKRIMDVVALETGQAFNPTLWSHWSFILSSSMFWAAIISLLIGIVLWVVALHIGRVSIVGPVVGGFIVFIPVIFGLTGIIIEPEPFSVEKAIGIVTITIGSMGLARKDTG